ncbi:MAG: response regulator [Kiritimatiellae bacterium]|nr:response regulator [Kiritimatiellia bacterium]
MSGSESGPRFLVVDDSTTMRRILRNCLGKCGYTDVTEACDGSDAVAKAEQEQFDLILADWNMPICDGLEMTQRIRRLPGYQKTPIIMVTTEGSKEDVVEALTHGVNSYVVKPFTPEIIKEKVTGLLQG